MDFSTSYLDKCIKSLERAIGILDKTDPESIDYELYRSACIKEFEIILEQAGKLLRKSLKPYFASSKKVDGLTFKSIFRHAAKFGIISLEECERWITYRDNRNTTAHDYGVGFAENTLKILPTFLLDSKNLLAKLNDLDADKNQG